MGRSLTDVLEESRRLGFLGPGPIEEHVTHAQALLATSGSDWQQLVDLGSGGGVPGLIIASEHPDREVVLLDGATRRTAFLEWAVAELGLPNCSVVEARAEVAGRTTELRSSADLVASRSFGPPAVTAECAAPLLRVGGCLVVSEPPNADDEHDRWPSEGLERLGMRLDERIIGPPRFVRIIQASLCPETYPRRAGVPARRPLFRE